MKRVRNVLKEIERAYNISVSYPGSIGIGIVYFLTSAIFTYWLAWGNKWWGNGNVSGFGMRVMLILLGLSTLLLFLGWMTVKSRRASANLLIEKLRMMPNPDQKDILLKSGNLSVDQLIEELKKLTSLGLELAEWPGTTEKVVRKAKGF